MQGLFVITGISLIVIGLNGSRPLVVAGAVLIGLVLAHWRLGRGKHRKEGSDE